MRTKLFGLLMVCSVIFPPIRVNRFFMLKIVTHPCTIYFLRVLLFVFSVVFALPFFAGLETIRTIGLVKQSVYGTIAGFAMTDERDNLFPTGRGFRKSHRPLVRFPEIPLVFLGAE